VPSGVFATPRPIPGRLLPAIGGTLVIVLALPIFLIAGWPVAAWGLAAVLWVAFQAIGLVLERMSLGMGNLASAGVVAIGRMTRAVLLTAILIVVAVSDSTIGLPAALVYALAFTVEFGLSVLAYFGGEEKA
jgi:hypothetical protein